MIQRKMVKTIAVQSKCQEYNNKNEVDTTSQGASWDGETFTLSRLVQNVAVKTNEGKYIDLPFEEILWGYFTLQDAVDFARYAVETTIQTMHFKNVVETVRRIC